MAARFLTRWFGLGRMPRWVLDEIAAEKVIYRTEGIRVTLRRNGHVRGTWVRGAVSVGWGAFAVTDRRVVGSRGRVRWVNVPFEHVPDGPATLTLDGSGLHIVFDLDRVHPATTGTMRADFRQQLSAENLARFPAGRVSFAVDPQKVVRLFGSLLKLPS